MKKSYLKYIISLLIFGSNGVVASYINLSSSQIVLSRTMIGSLFLGMLFIVGKKHLQIKQIKKQGLYLVGSGGAMGLSWIFLFAAYRLTSVSTATLAYYCGPVMVMAAAPFLFREKTAAAKICGIFVVVVGMMLVNGADVLTAGVSAGLVCGLFSALLYAVMIIFNKKITGLTGLESTLVQLITACGVVAIYTVGIQEESLYISGADAVPVLFLGLVNTGLACYLYFSSIRDIPAQSVAICSYIDPLSALVFSAGILHEQLRFLQVVGAILILSGAALGELYPSKSKLDLS